MCGQLFNVLGFLGAAVDDRLGERLRSEVMNSANSWSVFL
jgi:hypothetical protein